MTEPDKGNPWAQDLDFVPLDEDFYAVENSPGEPPGESPDPDPLPVISDDVADQLLRDVATGLYDMEQLCERAAVPENFARAVLNDPDNEPIIMRYRAEWLSDSNQETRVQRRARIVVEESIDHLGKKLIDDQGLSLAQRLAVFDSVNKLTGLNVQGMGGTGPRMTVNIHISGRDAVQVGHVIEHTPDAA
jgi:hypothetical protein